MKRFLMWVCAVGLLLSVMSPAQAWIGISIGVPVPAYRPYPYPYYPYYPYYRPYPYYYPYYAPPPPAVYPPPPVYSSPASGGTLPAPKPTPQKPATPSGGPELPPPPVPANTPLSVRASEPPVLTASVQNDLNHYLQRLNDSSAQVRSETALTLGRSKTLQAVIPLQKLLAYDQSPVVREAAARALGLIGSPDSLKALQTAAQADDDTEVRHSARFAAESIRGK